LNQSTPSLRPLYGTQTINGLNTVGFDGTDDRMSFTQTNIVRGGITKVMNEIWSVVHMNETTEETIFGNSTASSGFAAVSAGQLMLTSNILSTPYSPDNPSTDIVGTTTAYILGFIGDLNKKYSINGTLETLPDSISNSGTAIIRVNQIGFRTGGAFSGVMGELIIKPISSTTTRQKMEGYLAWKWGLEGNLPSDHPYKNAAPITPPSTPTDLTTSSVSTSSLLCLGQR